MQRVTSVIKKSSQNIQDMYDVPALEMYINYDKTTHNPIEKSVGTV